ncbi:AAA family ATPase [Legionella jordanis]|uniref:Methanol dehydrogenase regulatory protein n=1 Tax=Legionella jordanis TaxID=456 RepID=A0A0W0VD47_9GAMM|nr:MoxR family ATPase [Legionella jordanis]KTD18032.1 methanol dehydrogenase regulatory protein [Legionella jordanis]RMX02281.1 MoxR family ATPase [Legionella jordanis]RMX21234.1 MoxR family ATPase [Legionella jordanis]VEH13876.1 MoxR protein (ATPase) methanol dehydrogenase regulatory protein [Legionella jordanis]HAT8714258.1 AAA domain-containing protein [Legionella jordanis]
MEQLEIIAKEKVQERIAQISAYLNSRILGQQDLVSRLLIALLADGHLLVEGAPGLAKTRAVKELSSVVEGDFHRIQFTPDLLPGDLTGTDVYRPENGTFVFQPGPIFHHLILADEINRAPAKVQSALLEAMAERQVTIGGTTYPLPELFLVMATQNPIEQEGTYPLPEAQLDRFLMYVKINYPEAGVEHNILSLARTEARGNLNLNNGLPDISPLSQASLFEARRQVLQVHSSEALDNYLVQLVVATRNPGVYSEELERWLRFGASPRATIALDRCAKAHAWLAGRDYVTPEDIHVIAHDVLRHRILLSFEAEAEGVSSDDFIDSLLRLIAVP